MKTPDEFAQALIGALAEELPHVTTERLDDNGLNVTVETPAGEAFIHLPPPPNEVDERGVSGLLICQALCALANGLGVDDVSIVVGKPLRLPLPGGSVMVIALPGHISAASKAEAAEFVRVMAGQLRQVADTLLEGGIVVEGAVMKPGGGGLH